MLRSRRLRVASLAAVVLALLVSSCSVSSSKSTKSSSPTSGVTSGGGGVDYAAKFANDPVQGITPTTIKLGIAAIDYKTVKQQYHVDLGNFPDQIIPALVAAANKAGGINGRKIEVSVRQFIPVGTQSSDQSCNELTEDDKVFAVMGMYLADNALCVTQTHKTTYFSAWGLNAGHQERSNAPYIIGGASDEQNAVDAMNAAIRSGVLKGKKVAVYWENDTPDSIVNDQVIGTLRKGGVDVVSQAKEPTTTDQVQAGNDLDRILQRFQAQGANAVVFLSGMANVIPALQRTSWHPQIVVTNGQATGGALSGFGLTDPKVLDGAVAFTNSVPNSVVEKDPGFLACLQQINDNSDLHLKPTDIVSTKDDPSSLGVGILPQFCEIWQLTLHVLKAAGPNPSASSIITGMKQLSSFSIPLIPDASLGPDKWYTGTTMRTWHFDLATKQFEPQGS